MTTVSSSITKNTGRYAMIHTAFFIFLESFNLPHYATNYMHHTGKIDSKKIFQKEKSKVTKNSLQELKVNTSIH